MRSIGTGNNSKKSWFKKKHKINVGRKASKITKEKISKFHKGKKWRLGMKNSASHREKIGLAQIGKKHYNWHSKKPSYGSVHLWLLKYYKYKKTKCVKCPSNRFLEFSLKKGKSHTHNINNYLILCSSCHKKYDYTDERRRKLSIAHKGRKITWDTRGK